MGTMLRGDRTADFVIILRTLPVKSAMQTLGSKIVEELQKIDPTTPFHSSYRDDFLELFNIYSHDIVKVRIATLPENFKKLNPEIHIRRTQVVLNLESIHHAKWFDEVVKPLPNVINLIRIMKDVVRRFKDFEE